MMQVSLQSEEKTSDGIAAQEYVLEKDGAVIGRARVMGEVLTFCTVREEWRKKGYGTFLLRRVMRTGKILYAQTPQDEAGRALLRRCGFRLDETEQGARWTRILPHDDGENALSVAHSFLKKYVSAGMTALDATAGNGGDTLFLCRLVGKTGRVLAFDIQPQAVENTNCRLREEGFENMARAVLDSHSNMAQYVQPQTVDAVMFNLGYLPGGDHSVFTQKETSIPAIRTALTLLRPGGVMTVCVYSGRAQGTQERDAVLEFFAGLPREEYDISVREFKEQQGLPPVPVCVRKKPLR